MTETETQAPEETTAVSSSESTLAPTPTKKPPTPTPTEIPLNYAVEPQFDYASEFNQYGFATAYIGEYEDREYFYINEQGEFVNNPLFGIDENPEHSFVPFEIHCGLDLFPEGDLYGYVNEENEVAIAPQYEDAQPFSPNGLAGVMVGGKWGYINEKNEMVVEPQYDRVGMFFDNGYAGVSKDGKFTLIDSTGKIIKSTDYEYYNVDSSMDYFHEPNVAFLRCYDESANKWGLMNIDGKEILAPEYINIDLPSENAPGDRGFADHGTGLIMVEKDEGMYGLVSQNGEVILEPIRSYGIAFGEQDIATIHLTLDDPMAANVGYINKEGKFITETRFVYASLFAYNGLAAVCEEYVDGEWGKFGYIGVDGTYVIDPVFDWASEFTSVGLAYAQKGDMSGLINSEGEYVYTASGEITDFYDLQVFGDLLQISYSDRTEYVNSDGEIVKVMPAGTYW
ncbi:MAG: WG repeat-containing protein, partial [Clostridiales bacterium]|nr:WG repeat-containing protein [Clostridiales bacterium]